MKSQLKSVADWNADWDKIQRSATIGGLIPENVGTRIREMVASKSSGNVKINFRNGTIIGYTVEQHVTVKNR